MTPALEQFLVRATLLKTTLGEDENAVGRADGTQPEGNHEVDATRKDRREAALDELLGLDGDRRGSSMTKSWGLASCARTKESNWRWSVESRLPPSPTGVA
jgi:hypothetical protein